jgi:predicted acyltransferase
MATIEHKVLPAESPAWAEPVRSQSTPADQPTEKPARLASLDAYRGFIMLVMASSGFAFAQVANRLDMSTISASTIALLSSPTGSAPLQATASLIPQRTEHLPASQVWNFLGYQFDHVPWIGCSFWDLIQPSFMFMVGVALPYSFASRRARGDSYRKMLAHAIVRSLILILLAVFLSSPLQLSRGTPAPQGPLTNWIFVNVLAQIGLGYVFVFLLVGRGLRVQLAALGIILAGYTLLFGLYPLPGTDYDWSKVGVPAGWAHLSGWFAHWDKNSNVAHFFDVWFLNLFHRAEPFRFNAGGYQTLNFIPSMATMILGLMAGELLRGRQSTLAKFGLLLLAAGLCLALGMLAGQFVCPIVKRIWTPSWAIFSAGWTFFMLALFFGVIDIVGFRRWAFPLIIVGMNSIAMYVMSQLLKPWTGRSLRIHLGRTWFEGDYGPVVQSAAILLVLWLFCLWLYRRKIFIRI